VRLGRLEIYILTGDRLTIAQQTPTDPGPRLQGERAVPRDVAGGHPTPTIRADGEDFAFAQFGFEAKVPIRIRARFRAGVNVVTGKCACRTQPDLLARAKVNHLRVDSGFGVRRQHHSARTRTSLKFEVPSSGARLKRVGE